MHDLVKFNSNTGICVVTLVKEMLQLNDPYTAFHQEDTTTIALYISQKMNLGRERQIQLATAAELHDIGKQGIPKVILSKPTKLSENEYKLVQDHVTIGVELLQKVNFDKDVIRIISEHHEKLDGSGYPKQLKGDQISLEGQIIAVADIVSALTTKRTYRPPTSKAEVEDILLKDAGTKLNRDVVKYAIEYLNHSS